MAIGYAILDQNGQEVDTRRIDSRLPPVMNGVPSALQFVAGASLAPGEYTLKLAAADGERVGSVEHRFNAKLAESGAVKLSELMTGGPTAIREFLSPTIGYTVSFGSVHGYIEAYGDQSEAVTVKYEIAAGAAGARAPRGRCTGTVVRRRQDDLHPRHVGAAASSRPVRAARARVRWPRVR